MKEKSICDTHCILLNSIYKKMDKKVECEFYKLLYYIKDENVRYVLEKKIKEKWVDINNYLVKLKTVINFLNNHALLTPRCSFSYSVPLTFVVSGCAAIAFLLLDLLLLLLVFLLFS